MKKPLLLLILWFLAGQSFAQSMWPDGTGVYVTGHRGQQTLTYFGICSVVTNNGALDIAIPTEASAEWLSFLGKPPPNVTLSPCPVGCGAYQNGQTWTGDYTETAACPAGGGTETRTDEGTYQCNNGTVAQIGSTPLTGFDQSACSCAGHADGSQWQEQSKNTEACSADGYGAGATGNAVQTVTTTYQCNAGAVQTVSSSSSAFDSSQCLNSNGGACAPIPASQCTALNTTQPDPSCEFTAVQFSGGFPPGYGQWKYYEYESTIQWSLSSDACSCVGTPVTVPGQIGTYTYPAGSTVAAFNPSQYPLTGPSCPNQSAPCLTPCP